jgi:fatty-acyl-CoA synthase/long-chain acyl-CoA synthetase
MNASFPAVGELYAQALTSFTSEIALIDGETSLSYSELAEHVGRTMAAFDGLGLTPGDRIGLGLNISKDFVELMLAAQIAGLTVVDLPPSLPWELLEHRVNLAKVDVSLFRGADFAEEACARLGSLPGRQLSIGHGDFAADFAAKVQACEPAAVTWRPTSAPGAINFTSGTTGLPKAISVNASAPAAQTLMLMATINHPIRPVCVLGMTIPVVMHLLLTPTVIRGGTVVTVCSTDLEVMVGAARKHNANLLFLPTRMLYSLLDEGDAGWIKRQVELFYYGGENMTVDRLKEAVDTCGSIFAQIYGASESGPVGILRPQDHDPETPELLGSVGRTVVGAQIQVRDEAGNVLPPDEPGCLVLRAPTAMTEYLEMPEKTRETLIDGWVKPGDVGYRDARGYFYLLDRDSFSLEVEGKKVFPRSVEMALGQHRGISGVVAMGVKDAGGEEERLCVAVKCRKGASVSADDVSELVMEAHQVRPHRVIFLDDFPLNPVSRKIDRPKLEELFRQADA